MDLGSNGAGKTTLMRIITTLLKADKGQASIASLKGLKNYKENIKKVINQVGLEGRAKDKTGSYSGGMKQRLGIAQAILGDPVLLITDEPTAGLDPEERVRFRNLLVELAENKTVILSTHIVGDIEASCNELAVLHQGEVLFQGKTEKLARMASGKVWEVIQEGKLPDNCYVISSRRQGDKTIKRVLADENPGGKALESNLEDGYMYLMRGANHSTGFYNNAEEKKNILIKLITTIQFFY